MFDRPTPSTLTPSEAPVILHVYEIAMRELLDNPHLHDDPEALAAMPEPFPVDAANDDVEPFDEHDTHLPF